MSSSPKLLAIQHIITHKTMMNPQFGGSYALDDYITTELNRMTKELESYRDESYFCQNFKEITWERINSINELIIRVKTYVEEDNSWDEIFNEYDRMPRV